MEKKSDAQLARKIEVALPVELSREDQITLLQKYIAENFTSAGMCADMAIHKKHVDGKTIIRDSTVCCTNVTDSIENDLEIKRLFFSYVFANLYFCELFKVHNGYIASCYFSTKQSVAVYMVIVGSVNLAIFILIILCIGSSLNIGVLQLGLYMMTAFFLSNIVSMGILSTEIGRENRYFLFINSVFLAIGYTVFSAVPTAFSAVSLGAWGIACFILGSLFALQLKKLFAEMIKGEILCMN